MSSIITVDELNTYTGETLNQARATQVVDAVNDYIESVTGRCWGTTKTATETYDYASVVFLRNQDIAEVSKVETGQGNKPQTTVDANNYYVNDVGRLVLSEERANFRRIRELVHVTYTYGVEDVPNDLKLASLAVASDYYNSAANGTKEVTAESIGSYRLEYGSNETNGTPSIQFATINRYRKRRL